MQRFIGGRFYDLPKKLFYGDIGKDPRCQHLKIFLDGIEQKYVTSFDVDKGWIERYKRENDNYVLNEDDWATVEEVRGVVTVEWK